MTTWAATAVAAEPTSPPDSVRAPVQEARSAGDSELGILMSVEVPGGRVGTGPDGNARDILGPRFNLGFELGVRITPRFRLAPRLSGFVGGLGDSFDAMCDAGREASEADPDTANEDGPAKNETCGQLGGGLSLHARYDFRERLPVMGVGPWVSLGMGVEALKMMGSSGGSTSYHGSFEGSFTGINFAMPELGLDFRASETVVVALFASAKIGRYVSRSGTLETFDEAYEAEYGAGSTHTWIGGGLSIATF